jgi:hypothetical protein
MLHLGDSACFCSTIDSIVADDQSDERDENASVASNCSKKRRSSDEDDFLRGLATMVQSPVYVQLQQPPAIENRYSNWGE